MRRTSFTTLMIAGLTAGCIACGNDTGPTEPAASIDWSVWAEPTTEVRPWVRWWWPGTDVEVAEVERELQVLVDTGFGGAEVQIFDAALDPEVEQSVLDARRQFDTPRYHELLEAVLVGAESRDLTLDLTFGSGWPVGGNHIAIEDSMLTLIYGEERVSGPQALTWEPAPRLTSFYEVADVAAEAFGERLTRWMPEFAELAHIAAYPQTGGSRSSSFLDVDDAIELDANGYIDLTANVADGMLTWDVPAGDWTVVASFFMPDGGYPTLIAQPGDPYIANHFDSDIVRGQLDYVLGPHTAHAGGSPDTSEGGAWRGFFTDSLEFKSERFMTRDFFDVFEASRGYDIRPLLPAVYLPGADNFVFEAGRIARGPEYVLTALDERIRFDVRHTISELFIERYAGTTSTWAADQGLQSRMQGYGADIDNIAAMAAVDIPETESLYAGGAEMFLRLASSAAVLSGAPIVSAESLVWPLRDFMTTPAKMRAAADKLIGSGVNQLIFHGFPYDYEGAYGEPGWTAFSSTFGGGNTFASTFGERSEFFDALPELTRYVGRAQHLMRQGTPHVDVFVVYPFLGFPTGFALNEDHYEPLIGGYVEGMEPRLDEPPFSELTAFFGDPVVDERSEWLAAMWPTLLELEHAGYTWSWLPSSALSEATVDEGQIHVREGSASALLLAGVPLIQLDEAASLEALASDSDGPVVLTSGALPRRQPGFANASSNDAQIVATMDRLGGLATNITLGTSGTIEIRDGEPGVRSAGDIVSTLSSAGLAPRFRLDGNSDGTADINTGLQPTIRHLGDDAAVLFLRNSTYDVASATVVPAMACEDGIWLDAWSGDVYPYDASSASLTLDPWTSIFLVCGVADIPEAVGPAPWIDRPSLAVAVGDWSVTVTGSDVADGEHTVAGTFSAELAELGDLRVFSELATCSSDAIYTTTIDVPDGGGMLDFGLTPGVIVVRVDDVETELLVSPFAVPVSAGEHTVEVRLRSPLRNRLVGFGITEDPEYLQFAGKEDTTMVYGLVGAELRTR